MPLALARLSIGVYFIYMGLMKIQDPIAFLKQIHLYEMLPESPAYFLNGTAVAVPWLEVVCGLALLLGVCMRGAGALIAGMLVVFTPAILLRALSIQSAEGTPFMQIAFDCGCGTGEVIIWKKLLSNTGCFLAALIPVFSSSRRWCLTGQPQRDSLERTPASVAEPSP